MKIETMYLHHHLTPVHLYCQHVSKVPFGEVIWSSCCLKSPDCLFSLTTALESWWSHQMETFSALLAICAGNSPVTGESPAQRPVTRSFDVFFDLRLSKRLSKQSWGWWSETPSGPLWRHCNVVTLYRWPVDSIHKRPVTRKVLYWHDGFKSNESNSADKYTVFLFWIFWGSCYKHGLSWVKIWDNVRNNIYYKVWDEKTSQSHRWSLEMG